MKASDVATQVKSLRTQLEVLAAKLQPTPTPDNHTLADLHGMLADQTQTSAEEIEEILYREAIRNE